MGRGAEPQAPGSREAGVRSVGQERQHAACRCAARRKPTHAALKTLHAPRRDRLPGRLRGHCTAEQASKQTIQHLAETEKQVPEVASQNSEIRQPQRSRLMVSALHTHQKDRL